MKASVFTVLTLFISASVFAGTTLRMQGYVPDVGTNSIENFGKAVLQSEERIITQEQPMPSSGIRRVEES